MKLFVKLLVLLLIAAMAGPFFIKGTDGQPLMRWSDVTQKLKSWVGSGSSSKPGSPVKVHRWQDENGQWHYSDEAPAQNSEVITVDPNVNVIQSTPVTKPTQEASAPAPAPDKPQPEADKLPSIFNPIDETNQVKEELEQRNKELKQRLDDT